jgi:hypothetical protein
MEHILKKVGEDVLPGVSTIISNPTFEIMNGSSFKKPLISNFGHLSCFVTLKTWLPAADSLRLLLFAEDHIDVGKLPAGTLISL